MRHPEGTRPKVRTVAEILKQIEDEYYVLHIETTDLGLEGIFIPWRDWQALKEKLEMPDRVEGLGVK